MTSDGKHRLRRTRWWVTVLGIGLLAISCWAGYHVWRMEHARRVAKSDLKEISHITYGLFNVDEWRAAVSLIIERKINQLQVTDQNREEIRKQLIILMRSMIQELEGTMERANTKAGFKGDVRRAAMGLLVDMEAIKADVPRYADRVLDEINKPETRDRLHALLLKEFNKMADQTKSMADYQLRDRILLRHGYENPLVCKVAIEAKVSWLRYWSGWYLGLLLVSVAALTLLVLVSNIPGTAGLMLLAMGSLLLLVLGVQLPMIDIEASIARFSLQLIGEDVGFEHQVLYFQSKSILEVVWLMLKDGDPGLLLVGVLVLTFSVLLPFGKLVGTLRLLMWRTPPRTAVGQFLVYKSGKWSMADVIVVAIFMAYLGFSGIVNGQLQQIEVHDPRTDVLTTNGSELQSGFYLFFAYCIMGLIVSALVQRRVKANTLHA